MSEMVYATPKQMFKINKLTHLLSGVRGVPSASMPISKSDANDLIQDMIKVEELLVGPKVVRHKGATSEQPVRDGEVKVIKISI